jgi:hypothetical protein
MFTSDELVFIWPIEKALLVVVVSIGILVYVAWVGTKRMSGSSAKRRPDPVKIDSWQAVVSPLFSIRNSMRRFRTASQSMMRRHFTILDEAASEDSQPQQTSV